VVRLARMRPLQRRAKREREMRWWPLSARQWERLGWAALVVLALLGLAEWMRGAGYLLAAPR